MACFRLRPRRELQFAPHTPAGTRRRLQFDLAGRPSATYFTEDLAVAFEWAAQDLIKDESRRVGRCETPGCDKLFIRIKASRYCSLAQSQRARSQRFYNRHKAELSERRHELYKEKVAVERGEATAKKVRRQKRIVRS
jgi:predicted RNA-binding Zn ribbon-like protein